MMHGSSRVTSFSLILKTYRTVDMSYCCYTEGTALMARDGGDERRTVLTLKCFRQEIVNHLTRLKFPTQLICYFFFNHV